MSSSHSRALSPRAVMAPIAVLLAAALFLFAGFAVAEQAPDTNRYIVKFKDGKGPQGKGALRRAGAELLLELEPQNAAAFRIPSQALAGIARNPNVEYVEVDPPRYPMADTVPYGIAMVQADPSTGLAPGTSVRKVCIIDSGYDDGHEDLDSNVTGEPGGDNPWNADYCGHGTHVAGTIAALGGNAKGVVGVIGDPASIDLHIVKVFGSPTSSCGWSYASALVDAANQCGAEGADIINMSLGCSGRRCASNTEAKAFQDLYAAGVLSIAAAGNDGNRQYSYPASYDSVVSVAAVDSSGRVASFSQQNDQVELSGPGVSVLSTVPNNGYATASGTSMATPHVAGVAALVWSHHGSATAAEIRDALQRSALDLGPSGRDNAYGFGLVQAVAADEFLRAGSGGGGGDDPAPNEAPTASFTYDCTGLSCSFTFTGSDPEGGTLVYDWTFGDQSGSNADNPAHTYNGAGTYTVELTVTDDAGASDSAAQSVTVTDPSAGGGLSLVAVGYKVRGVHTVDLSWEGASGDVVVTRDGTTTVYTGSDTSFTDDTGNKGGGSYSYQVCESPTGGSCSEPVTVNF